MKSTELDRSPSPPFPDALSPSERFVRRNKKMAVRHLTK
ncbi:hypothetical protein TGS27_1162 [Geobacillus stearothermophilus]|uniref:Uncharacterized protein n=1 Tax=Geobacillus stearothermophilus TaxID=1422 RepID=A0A150N7F6_GEOSE|nr:hypothetical protein GS8_781 [Geobacillus stearothermophilus]KYD32651.1 hypothetical protein B4114_2749 [Geobacillus stearothermophilus]OAO83422.1 hypothetical protein TGS27_1162 [Geobacillus stearothermophilus]